MENDVLYNRIMNVVHEEYGSGGTAVANPEGEATDDLEKIQIGDDIYSISGSGGGMLLTISQVDSDWVLDKNYTEIKTALESGIYPIAVMPGENGMINTFTICDYGYSREKYVVELHSDTEGYQGPITFLSDTDDGVLVMYQGE